MGKFFQRTDMGRLYVLRITTNDGQVIHKIGMTHSARSTDRMLEVLRSWFIKYRYVPHTELRLDLACDNPAGLEKYLHRLLNPVQFIPKHKVDGGTELFAGLDEVRLLHFIRSASKKYIAEYPDVDRKTSMVICKLLCNP